MSALRVTCVALSLCLGLAAAPATGQPAASASGPSGPKPPMNDFNQAFYRCDGGANFMMSYDGDDLAKAEMAANDGAKPHVLKRAPAKDGVEYTGGGVRFWTDGKTVVVEGAKSPFKNCKTKVG